jgi:hypothetical protein
VHVAPACTGSDHFGSYVRSPVHMNSWLAIFLHQRHFSGYGVHVVEGKGILVIIQWAWILEIFLDEIISNMPVLGCLMQYRRNFEATVYWMWIYQNLLDSSTYHLGPALPCHWPDRAAEETVFTRLLYTGNYDCHLDYQVTQKKSLQWCTAIFYEMEAITENLYTHNT